MILERGNDIYMTYFGKTIVFTLWALEEALDITESAVSGLYKHILTGY